MQTERSCERWCSHRVRPRRPTTPLFLLSELRLGKRAEATAERGQFVGKAASRLGFAGTQKTLGTSLSLLPRTAATRIVPASDLDLVHGRARHEVYFHSLAPVLYQPRLRGAATSGALALESHAARAESRLHGASCAMIGSDCCTKANERPYRRVIQCDRIAHAALSRPQQRAPHRGGLYYTFSAPRSQ